MSGCGKLVKGSHPKDDAVPCGTKLRTFLSDRKTMIDTVHLCSKCRAEEETV